MAKDSVFSMDDPAPIRSQIKGMSGFGSEEEMAESLPETTIAAPGASAPGEKPKRKRRTQAEMAAVRGQTPGVVTEEDVLMQDPRYAKAVGNMRSAGVGKTIKGGFNMAAIQMKDDGWKLEPDEEEDVDDFSYVLSKKYNLLDPTRTWYTMAIYFCALMGTLIFKRAGRAKVESWLTKLTDIFKEPTPELTREQQEEERKKGVM